MASGAGTLLSPLRIRIPFLMDLVVVSRPDQIRIVEASGDVDRLHVFETATLPWWVRFFFRATKFHDHRRDLWFTPFESASNPTYPGRRAYLEEKVAAGYSAEDVQKIADLLTSNVDDDILAQEMVQVVNRRFFNKEIPPPVTRAAKNTLQKLSEAIFPWKYKRAIQSREQILEFCEQNLPKSVHILDVGHNIGEVVQASTSIRASKLGGLLWFATRPGKTVVILKVAKAASASHDLLFTFGTGKPERACVFMNFFLSFMRDLQVELRRRGG
jgi:hypothetical protein